MDETLRIKDVARILKLSPTTLRRWRDIGIGPRHFMLRGNARPKSDIRYMMSDVKKFIDANLNTGDIK